MKNRLISILFLISFSECNNTFCPAFPECIGDYFPYSKGSLIMFSNQDKDTLFLTVNNNWLSNSYSYKWNCKCACEANAGFITDLENKYLISIQGWMTIYSEENRSELNTEFYNGKINSDVFTVLLDNINPYINEKCDIFGDTIKIQKEDFNRIHTILIIKGKGIVEFFDKNQNCNWIKIE